MTRWLCSLCLVAVVCLSPNALRAADFSAMLNKVPSETNVLVMVDADRLLASEMSVAEGWRKKLAAQNELRPLLLPVSAKKLVRAVTLDVGGQSFQKEITLLDIPKGPSLEKIGKKHQGYVEKIANNDAVWLPQGAYGVKVASDVYGFMFPANRQDLSSWLRGRSGKLSTYLVQAATSMKAKGPQIVLAIDLQDVVPTTGLEDKLKGLQALSSSSQVNIPAITKVISSLRGAKFTVLFDKAATGTFTIEFEESSAPLSAVAKTLVLEVLANRGMTIDEMESWSVKVEGKSVELTGPIGESGIMRLSSLLEIPSDLVEDAESETDATNPQLYATQAHFKSVQKLTDDLFSKKWQTFGQYGQWCESYAKKIDRLPLLNVDEEMQQYSAQVADMLREGTTSFKGVGIRSAGRQSQVWNSNYVNYDYYGNRYYGTYDAGDQAKRAIRGEETAKGATDSVALKNAVNKATSEIRKKMVAKYKVEF